VLHPGGRARACSFRLQSLYLQAGLRAYQSGGPAAALSGLSIPAWSGNGLKPGRSRRGVRAADQEPWPCHVV